MCNPPPLSTSSCLDYPRAGGTRSDHRGPQPSFNRRKGRKSHGATMAVEEEGLRVFQSVKIKIGKEGKNQPQPHPPVHFQGEAALCSRLL